MSIVLACIAPHPPIIIPEVGGDELKRVTKTREAMQELACKIKETVPDTIIIISPHGPVFEDAVTLPGQTLLRGSFARFGAPEVSYSIASDPELVSELSHACRQLNVPTLKLTKELRERFGIREDLDHGTLVPLHYLQEEGITAPVVTVGMSLLPPADLYNFGRALALASARLGKRVAVVASGDLSHRLIPAAPAGYDPQGEIFDLQVLEIVKKGDLQQLLGINPQLAEKAGECGWRSIIMMSGSLDKLQIKSKVLSYEGPFGVGYLVAYMTPGAAKSAKEESEYVKLARRSLETYVIEKRRLSVSHLPKGMERKAGVFVSLKWFGQLRGCIGTFQPTQNNIAEEIIENAISAGIYDPRFYPVEKEELPQLTYSVDILGALEPVAAIDELDPACYGVVVQSGSKRGLLLPNLEGVTTAAQQVEIACEKAGITSGKPAKLYRFRVERYY